MKKVTLLISALLCAGMVNSQTLKDLTEMKQKKKERMVKIRSYGKPNKKGEGLSPALDKKCPKKIGIVSFYVFDEGYQYSYSGGTYESFGTQYKVTKYHGRQLSDASGSALASTLLAKSLLSIDSVFEARGFEFLVPREYLDTQEKIDAYNNFQPEVTKVAQAAYTAVMTFAASATNDMGSTAAQAKGFRYIPFHQGFKKDYRYLESMGQFADTLGLDGVLLMMANTPSQKKAIEMESVQLAIYGRNPIPEGDRWHPGLSYNTGMIYSDATLKLKKDPEIIEVDKKTGKFTNVMLDGYDELITLFTDQVAKDLRERCKGNY